MGSNTNIVHGKEALVQGYGLSEDGKNSWVFDYIDLNVLMQLRDLLIITLIYLLLCLAGKTSDELREATVNIIENIECSSYLNGNTTNHAIRRATVKQTLPNGINSQLICSTGIRQEDGVYTVNMNYKINNISAKLFYLRH